ncbi:MAG: sodium/alanine symporter, partial [Bdellovibrionota bacterium]
MEMLEQITGDFVGLVWGVPLVLLLVGSGILFTFYFGFPQLRFFRHAIDITFGRYDNPKDQGEISHFQALCSALSAT